MKYRFDRTLSLRLYPAPCAACDPCTACIPAIALYDIKVARNKQTIEEYADRVVELQLQNAICHEATHCLAAQKRGDKFRKPWQAECYHSPGKLPVSTLDFVAFFSGHYFQASRGACVLPDK